MRDWNIEQEEDHVHRGRKINKERFCKKNKLDGNQYGSHIYENGRCSLCNKVDPLEKNNKETQ